MLGSLLADAQASPLTAIFVLTLITTLILQKLYQWHVKLTKARED